ncbi:MAG: hypothetical protein ACK518_01845 [bacterium]
MDLLEAKNVENEIIIREQDKEIVKLKTKIYAIQLEPHHISEPIASDAGADFPAQPASIEMLTIQINKNPSSDGDSSTKAVAPSSCRELSLIGHSLDGLYLLQNPKTRKIETVFCDFIGESTKFNWYSQLLKHPRTQTNYNFKSYYYKIVFFLI